MKISRRGLLRGMLGGATVCVGLPALEVFLNSTGTAHAGCLGFPKRFGMFYWGNGNLPQRWIPAGDGADWQVSEQLAPLAPVKELISVVTGLSVRTGNDVAHASGAAGLLTGAPLLFRDGGHTFAAPTIDQIIAQEIGGETRFRSLEFGAEPAGGLSYNGPDNRNPPEPTPFAFFERVFGAGFREPGDDGAVDPTLALRRSVLDVVGDDVTRLNMRLGASDRARLDQHLTGIRELELRIARMEAGPPDLASCTSALPPNEAYPDIDGRPQLSAKHRAMCDIVALALACDQTRVFSNYFTYPVNNLLFDGALAGHHQLTHDEPGDQPQVHAIVLQIMEEFAYFIQALQNIPEGDGTLLDHTCLVGWSEISDGRTHSLDEMPIVYAGNLCGTLKQGIHYRPLGAENASRFHVTVMRALGMRVAGFGHGPGEARESISGIEA